MGRTTGKEQISEKEILAQLNVWLMESRSTTNDGWVAGSYLDKLKNIQKFLNDANPAPAPAFENTPDDEMCF